MKKLEDFQAEKVEVKTIYGGKEMAQETTVHYSSSCTVGGSNNGCDDGPCDMPD